MSHPMVEQIKSNTLPAKSDLHLLRKIWHMSTGGLLLTTYFMYPDIEYKQWGYSIMALAILSFLIEYLRLKNQFLNRLILKVFSPFLRNEEKNSISGLPYYALGCAFSIFAFNEKICILAILFLIFSDPISSLFGVLYGKDKIFGEKSFQGSLAGFSICYLITLIYGLAYHEASLSLFFFALFAGIVGSVSELLSIYINDNFTIPVLSGFGLTLLNKIFVIF